MGTGFFAVGAVIFALYMYFTIWNIFNGSKKQREENGPVVDETDMDGMGNFSRFPVDNRDYRFEKDEMD
jgi:hypothetical protein